MATVNAINTYEVPTVNRERTMPLQPAFFAYNSTLRTNVTGDGTSYTIVFNTDLLDQNSDYNNTTGVFTAPVTGFYKFFASVSILDLDGVQHTRGIFVFDLNAGTDTFSSYKSVCGSIRRTVIHDLGVNISTGAYLTAADTVSVRLEIAPGSKIVDVEASLLTSFSGSLMF